MAVAKLTRDEIRQMAEDDLLLFARLINPNRVYGAVHEEIFRWWTREEAKDNQLVLLPRDHQKSHCVAVRVAWEITRDPATTILYVSATAGLAEKQLYAVKNILTSKIYRRYWPEMVHEQEGKRERWTTTEICVDHPLRAKEGVRDSTIYAAGLTTNVTGFHCQIAVLDDLVVPTNAYTASGRESVAAMYSQLSSIETTDAKEWVVGTRYHPDDLYNSLLDMEEEIYNMDGELIDAKKVYEVFERVVEDSVSRDGSGEFLWPRQRRDDGKYFGFDAAQLARKRAKYQDKSQFYAQYYNDPNDPLNAPIVRDWFQYYDKKNIECINGNWYYKDRRLNIIAAIDFAFSVRKKSDFTAIVVIGVDFENNIYVLDIIRFKTDMIKTMFEKLLEVHNKWDFRKVRAEVSVGQGTIVTQFREYMKDYGVFFSIDEHRPTRHDGTKEERIDMALRPRYENLTVWHYKGGNCQLLEEELGLAHPEHDDMKDALASAVSIAKAPMRQRAKQKSNVIPMGAIGSHRFGGI